MKWNSPEKAEFSNTHLLPRRLVFLVFGEGVTGSPESVEMAMRLVTLNLLAILLIPLFMLEYLLLGHLVLIPSIGMAGLVMICSIPIYRLTGNLAWARDAFVASLFAFKAGETLHLGSLDTVGAVWFTTMPVIGMLLGGARAGSIWLTITLAGIIGIFLFQEAGHFASPQFWAAQFFAFSLACVIVALFIFVMMAELGRRKAVRELEQANKRMRHLAERDGLTGLFNRRHVWEHLKARGHGPNLGLLLLDVDHFKSINDSLGHGAGDNILSHVAKAIVASAPEGSVVGRYGGEEFIVVLHGEDVARAYDIAEKIRNEVAWSTAKILPNFVGATISVGVSETKRNEPFTNALERADRALYFAKNAGRNKVAGEWDLPDTKLVG